jgi:hypothetical protein
MLIFDIRVTQPLGVLPQFPVTLGGKIVYVDAIVVHDPLDFNLLLEREYVFIMRYCLSTLL